MAKFKTVEEAQKAFDDLQKENNDQLDIITDLRSQLTVAKASANENKVIVEYDKEKYSVNARTFRHNNVEYKASDLVKDKALFKELVELGVGFLEKIQ